VPVVAVHDRRIFHSGKRTGLACWRRRPRRRGFVPDVRCNATGVTAATDPEFTRLLSTAGEVGKPPDFRRRESVTASDRVLFLHLRYIVGELLYVMNIITSRRKFLMRGGVVVAASAFGRAGLFGAEPKREEGDEEEEVSPAEDLMREHGVLKRVLLIYGEAIRRIEANEDLPPETVMDSAKIIRNFIEDYHEKLEEDFLFPRFKKAGKLVDLVDVLLKQHQGGRKVTDITMRFATDQALKNSDDRRKLADSLRQFIRMYNPHEAREDTILFPEFRKIVSKNEYDSLGEDFEKKEHELFGEDGFERMVDKVAGIEKKLGIYDLAQFTPKI
jgi:hemerythrin-like domain-containing protein